MANNTGLKYGGRKKGKENLVTAEIREKFKELVENNLDKFQEDLDNLKPIERVRILVDLAKFIVPTLKAVEVNSQVQPILNIIDLGAGKNPELIE
jgi:hypothetical protein